MIEKILAFLASSVFKSFFDSIAGYFARKSEVEAAKKSGWTEAHTQELENILKDNLEVAKLQKRIADAQKPPTIDALGDWLRDRRAATEANSGDKS